ncbi:unnamed protein product, partial [Rotaria magnacalcarata]
MSSNTHQSQSKNKKQRRKNARAALRQTHPSESEHAEVDLAQEILSTEQKHVETSYVLLKPEAIQQLPLTTDSPVEPLED